MNGYSMKESILVCLDSNIMACGNSHVALSPQIMRKKFDCVEDFKLVDQRLALCTLACGFSGFALIYDYLFPFPRSGIVLAVCAIRYLSYSFTFTVTSLLKR